MGDPALRQELTITDVVRCLGCGGAVPEAERRRHRARQPGLPGLRLPRLGRRQTSSSERAPLRRGSAAAPAPRNRADAAEVVVRRRPAPHRRGPPPRARSSAASSTPGSACTTLAGGVEARPVDRLLRLEALVEDPGEHARRAPCAAASRRRPRPRATRPSPSSASVGAIMLSIRSPGASGPREEVGLAEHAVQVQVEPGQEVARAEAEARREHARRALARRRRRGSSCGRRAARPVERVDEREHALASRASPRRRGSRSSVSAMPGEPAARQHLAPRVATPRRGSRPDRLVRGEVVARDEPAALLDEREQRLRDRPAVDRRGALGGERLERGDEPGLVERVARLEQPAARRVDPLALVHRHHRREHRQAATRAPAAARRRRARAAAPARTSRAQGSRPCAARARRAPPARPGPRTTPAPTA